MATKGTRLAPMAPSQEPKARTLMAPSQYSSHPPPTRPPYSVGLSQCECPCAICHMTPKAKPSPFHGSRPINPGSTYATQRSQSGQRGSLATASGETTGRAGNLSWPGMALGVLMVQARGAAIGVVVKKNGQPSCPSCEGATRRWPTRCKSAVFYFFGPAAAAARANFWRNLSTRPPNASTLFWVPV